MKTQNNSNFLTEILERGYVDILGVVYKIEHSTKPVEKVDMQEQIIFMDMDKYSREQKVIMLINCILNVIEETIIGDEGIDRDFIRILSTVLFQVISSNTEPSEEDPITLRKWICTSCKKEVATEHKADYCPGCGFYDPVERMIETLK